MSALEEASIEDADAFPEDFLGGAVSISADGARVLVGAFGADVPEGADAGAAFVFSRIGGEWSREARLVPPGLAPGDGLGYAVAIAADGTRAIVGAYTADTVAGVDAGAAHIFRREGTAWTHEAVLVAPDGAAGDLLGCAVAISHDGSRALVGSYYDDTAAGTDSGSTRVFVRAGSMWTVEALLVPDSGGEDDYSGRAVALNGNGTVAVIGTPFADVGDLLNAGSAQVFVRTVSGWAEEANLLSPNQVDNGFFGDSVAIAADGRRVLVGADSETAGLGPETGSTYVFVRGEASWELEATLQAADAATGDFFGYSVALTHDGTLALVGAYGDADRAGTARVFTRVGSAWREDATLAASAGRAGDFFGYSVAIADGARAVVGSVYDSTPLGSQVGTARVFTLAR